MGWLYIWKFGTGTGWIILCCRNLLSLKNFEGDVCELGLDFTVVNNDLGEAQVEELKPGGRDLLVDNHNRIEYIYLMANYRLNRQVGKILGDIKKTKQNKLESS